MTSILAPVQWSHEEGVDGSPANSKIQGWSKVFDVATRCQRPAAATNSKFSTVSPLTTMAGRPTNVHGPASDPVGDQAISKCWEVEPYLYPRMSPCPVQARAGSIMRSAGAGWRLRAS